MKLSASRICPFDLAPAINGASLQNLGELFCINDGVIPRTYRDRQDIALQTARFLKSRNPHSVVKLKDLETGEETVVAFTSEQ